MGIRQWFNRAASARKSWFGSYKKKSAERRARKRERELAREIDEAMKRTPQVEPVSPSMSNKPDTPEDDDWFTPITPVSPST